MDEFSQGVRRRRNGKLISVLRHGLRGHQPKDRANILASYAERGITPPESQDSPPTVDPRFSLYWTAYMDLQTERPPSLFKDKKTIPQRIPWSAIANYCQYHDLDVDELKRYVWALDAEMIDVMTAPESHEETPPPKPKPGDSNG